MICTRAGLPVTFTDALPVADCIDVAEFADLLHVHPDRATIVWLPRHQRRHAHGVSVRNADQPNPLLRFNCWVGNTNETRDVGLLAERVVMAVPVEIATVESPTGRKPTTTVTKYRIVRVEVMHPDRPIPLDW